jgi:flagellin
MALNAISNFSANVAQGILRKSGAALMMSLAKLSAGRRVLSARVDAASLAIGARLAGEISGLKQAAVNAGQGAAMLQVADGGMAGINDIVVRMKTLAVQAGSDTLSAGDRQALDAEYQALASEVDRIAADTEFAGTNLLDGSAGTVDFKVGTGTDSNGDDISVSLNDSSTAALAINGTGVASKASADAASAALDVAIDRVQIFRAGVGASRNRLDFASANIASTIKNTEAARSALIDLDVAQEMSSLAGQQILVQAGIAMLAQANRQPQTLLRLFS